MGKQIQAQTKGYTKEDRITILYESDTTKCKTIHKKIQPYTPCSLRTVQKIVEKIKLNQPLERKQRSDNGRSQLNQSSKKIKKIIEKEQYVDCTIIKKKLKINQSRQNIWRFMKQNKIADWDNIDIKPPLNDEQMKTRVEYCEIHRDDQGWKIFSKIHRQLRWIFETCRQI